MVAIPDGSPKELGEENRRLKKMYAEERPHSAHGYKPPATVRRIGSKPDTINPGLTA
jgi:hypothetical protein